MRLYLVHTRMWLFVLLLAVVGLASMQLAAAPAVQPKRASFDISNAFTIKVPEGAKRVRVWFAVPQGDSESEIRALKVEAPYPIRYGTDSSGNRMGYLEVNAPQEKQIAFRETFTLTRTEIRKAVDPAATRALTAQERADLGKYLQPSTYVLVNDEIKALANQIVGGEQNPVLAARKIYDWTLHNIDYWVKDPERLKPSLNGLDVDASYHCWIQFYAPNLDWVTLDVSVADIYMGDFPLTEKNQKLVELTTAVGYRGADATMVDYYFGNLDERRVVWSIGRDLQLDPPQEDGPVNALHKMYVEVDGKQYTDWTRQFTYREITASN